MTTRSAEANDAFRRATAEAKAAVAEMGAVDPPYRTAAAHPQTAYLCVLHRFVKTDGLHVPRFDGCSIYSEPPWSLTNYGYLRTIIYQAERPSYAEAEQELLTTCRDFKPFQWIWPWVDPSLEAHRRRFDMLQALRKEDGA